MDIKLNDVLSYLGNFLKKIKIRKLNLVGLIWKLFWNLNLYGNFKVFD
jgi:hypothetical protein